MNGHWHKSFDVGKQRAVEKLRAIATSIVLTALVVAMAAVAAAQGTQNAKPLAEVNGQPITEAEIDKAIAGQLAKLNEQIYNLRQQRLEAVIRERLLAQEAARRGITVQKLLDAEVTSKVKLVTEDEVEQFYQANKSLFGSGDEMEIRDQIRGRLQSQKVSTQRDAFVQSLRKNGKVVINLEPPPVTRVAVSTDGAPTRGGAKAPVTIVEFSDFHCPFCKRVVPTLKELETKYGDKVKLVFRDYPLDQLHPGARKAHEAARCAGEQGKFWEFHDALFAGEPDSSPQRLKRYAQQVGVDVAKFDQCVASGKHKELVQKDIDEGARLGVNGTPAFFINGELVSGAQPLEAFARIIDRELTRTR
jgi:protein-disulfide isomerase